MQIVPNGLAELFIDVWHRRTGVKPWSINRGWCYQFALVLARLHADKGVKLHTTVGHAWIEIDGVFYDSDTPQGTTEPLCSYYEPEQLSMQNFEEFWYSRGGSGPVNWDVIEEVIDIFQEKKAA